MNGYGKMAVLGVELGITEVTARVTDLEGLVPAQGQPGPAELDLTVLNQGALDQGVLNQDGPGQGRARYAGPVTACGRTEADPADWWLTAVRAVRTALAAAGPGTGIVALTVAAPLPGVVLVDGRGAALRPAILRLAEPAARPSAAILAWLAEREPRTLQAAWWALSPADWFRLRLTGQAATDPGTASATQPGGQEPGARDPWADARDAWSDDVIRLLGVPRGLLPPVRDPAELVGPLRPGPAAELGLRPGVTVTVGAAESAQLSSSASR